MRAVLQRVSEAKVSVEGKCCGQIKKGVLLLVGFEPTDNSSDFAFVSEKVVGLRIFEDLNGKMNLSVKEIDGNILVIPNFTLFGDARRGKRPSYSDSSSPKIANSQFEEFCKKIKEYFPNMQKGVFQATMKVELVNEGPVTILLDSKKNF